MKYQLKTAQMPLRESLRTQKVSKVAMVIIVILPKLPFFLHKIIYYIPSYKIYENINTIICIFEKVIFSLVKKLIFYIFTE